MKRFLKFITEMPHLAYTVNKSYFHDDDYEPVKKPGLNSSTQEYHERLSKDKHYHYYQSRYEGMERKDHEHDGFTITDHKGNVKYNISGSGNRDTKEFRVKHAEANQNRSTPYHHVISHLVSKGHVKKWISDTSHSPGSHKTYSYLANNPNLEVTHRNSDTGTEHDVTPDNVESFYGTRGRFIVRKREQ